MKSILRAACALAIASVALHGAGCVAESTTDTARTPNTGPTTSASPAPSAAAATPTPPASVASSSVPVTLPVLDAMFAEEAFTGELKSKLQLTDEQITKLRTISREATSGLRESEGDEHGGSTTVAKTHANEQIESVIGKEKADQLAAFVRERWSTGGEAVTDAGAAAATLPAQPSTVPSDTRVVVNAPAYRMDVFENGKLLKSYKVGIGYPEFPLPTGLRKANTIIFNPTWTPPDEPWVESSNKVKVGQKVEAGSPLNPLGLIKIPIGSPSLIHGGKSPAKLGTFASHGCVGLTNPQVQDFSQLLAQIGGAKITKQDVASYAKNRTETKNVKLENPIPVELRYETIIVEDGKLRIFRDVYDHGTNTEENLRAVLQAQGLSLDQLSEEERTQVMNALQEMARDATGKPSDGIPAPRPDTTNKNGQAASSGEKVTRAVKGKKEVTIMIAGLQGKGYPAPLGGGFATPKPLPTQKKTATTARGPVTPATKKSE